MSRFGARVSRLERDASRFTLEIFDRLLPRHEVESTLARAGRASQRRRALPAELVVWLVLAGQLWRSTGLRNVLAKLGTNFLRPLAWMKSGRPPTSGAVVRARRRLGIRVFHLLFRQLVARWRQVHAPALLWHGMHLLALDATTLRMADSPANRKHFGTHRCRHAQATAYPFTRVLVAMCLASHVVHAFVVGRGRSSELALAPRLLRQLPAHSLLVLDRGFLSYAFLLAILARGQSFVLRAKKGLKYRIVRRLGAHDFVVRIALSPALRRARPDLPATFELRKVRYHARGFRPVTLFTSLMDAQAFPAEELATLYRQRWEIELGFDEIKTHLLDEPVHLRSQGPAMVRQEIEALFLAYDAVRMHIAEAAASARLPPTRLSFIDALECLRETLRVMALSPTLRLPEIYAAYLRSVGLCTLPPRRPRRYPRERKGYGSTYKTKPKPRAA